MDNQLRCKICGNVVNNSPVVAKELMYGLKTEFD